MSQVNGVNNNPWSNWTNDLATGDQIAVPLAALEAALNSGTASLEQISTLYQAAETEVANAQNNPTASEQDMMQWISSASVALAPGSSALSIYQNYEPTVSVPTDANGKPIPGASVEPVTVNGSSQGIWNYQPGQTVAITVTFPANQTCYGPYFDAAGNTGPNTFVGSLVAAAVKNGSVTVDGPGAPPAKWTLTYDSKTGMITMTKTSTYTKGQGITVVPVPGVANPSGPLNSIIY